MTQSSTCPGSLVANVSMPGQPIYESIDLGEESNLLIVSESDAIDLAHFCGSP